MEGCRLSWSISSLHFTREPKVLSSMEEQSLTSSPLIPVSVRDVSSLHPVQCLYGLGNAPSCRSVRLRRSFRGNHDH